MKPANFFIAAFLSTGCTLTFAAGNDIQPGLWEIQHKTRVNGQQMPDMEEMMAKVPPEMRAQMKSMMAQQGAGISNKGVTICITAEQIAQGETGAEVPESDCKMTDIKQNGNKTNMKMDCTKPKANGQMEIVRLNDKHWKSATDMKTAEGQMNMEAEGKWLKADCGDVKPQSGKK